MYAYRYVLAGVISFLSSALLAGDASLHSGFNGADATYLLGRLDAYADSADDVDISYAIVQRILCIWGSYDKGHPQATNELLTVLARVPGVDLASVVTALESRNKSQVADMVSSLRTIQSPLISHLLVSMLLRSDAQHELDNVEDSYRVASQKCEFDLDAWAEVGARFPRDISVVTMVALRMLYVLGTHSERPEISETAQLELKKMLQTVPVVSEHDLERLTEWMNHGGSNDVLHTLILSLQSLQGPLMTNYLMSLLTCDVDGKQYKKELMRRYAPLVLSQPVSGSQEEKESSETTNHSDEQDPLSHHTAP